MGLLTTVDKMEQMLGSYGPSSTDTPYIKNFDTEESPSGIVARSGSYNVRSRVVDDDGEVYAGTLVLFRPRYDAKFDGGFFRFRVVL